jgi:prepilin-type processing-associated H-X9-DG protein
MATVEGSGTQFDPMFQYAGSLIWPGADKITYLNQVVRPAETALVSDGLTGTFTHPQAGRVIALAFGCVGAAMHQGGGNIVFTDGHAKWVKGDSERYLARDEHGHYYRKYWTYSK